jgi:hypothetical protein
MKIYKSHVFPLVLIILFVLALALAAAMGLTPLRVLLFRIGNIPKRTIWRVQSSLNNWQPGKIFMPVCILSSPPEGRNIPRNGILAGMK